MRYIILTALLLLTASCGAEEPEEVYESYLINDILGSSIHSKVRVKDYCLITFETGYDLKTYKVKVKTCDGFGYLKD